MSQPYAPPSAPIQAQQAATHPHGHAAPQTHPGPHVFPVQPGVAAHVAAPQPSQGMPSQVKIAFVLTGVAMLAPTIVYFAEAGASAAKTAWIPTLLFVAVLYGMAKRHPLAWQWARSLGMVLGVLAGFAALLMFRDGHPGFGALTLLTASSLATVATMLSTSAARQFFGLLCPRCGTHHTKSANLGYTKSKCELCKVQW